MGPALWKQLTLCSAPLSPPLLFVSHLAPIGMCVCSSALADAVLQHTPRFHPSPPGTCPLSSMLPLCSPS